MMRVVYYTEPAFLDLSMSHIQAMSRLVELHVLLQVRPAALPDGSLDVPPMVLPAGIVPAGPLLAQLPTGAQECWQDVASFNLVAHNCRHPVHPANWWVSHQAVRFMSRLKPEVVHLEGASGRLAWALPELRGVPVVLTVHDPEIHSGRRDWKEVAGRSLTYGKAQRFILRNRAQTELFCGQYRVPAERVDWVPLGVYSFYRHWAPDPTPADGRTVLFFGQISPYKGLDTLYRAAPLVCERVPGMRFVVAGKPDQGYSPPPPPDLPNGGRVEVIARRISNAELAGLFQQATVVACPYNDATQSGVVLTAYAFGKPVVASRVGGLPEYVSDGETGALVPPRSPEALAAKLSDLILRLPAEPALREHLARQIQRRVDGDLAWSAIARQTLEVYRRASQAEVYHL